MTRRKSRSGPTPPESQRHTVRATIRISPDDLDALDEYAAAIGTTRSEAVVRAVRAVTKAKPPATS